MEPMKGGSSSNGSCSTVEEDVVAVAIEGCDDSELELGLGLSLGVGVLGSKNHNNQIPRIFTAKDLPNSSPSSASSCSSLGLRTPNSTVNNIDSGGNNNNNTNNSDKSYTVGTKRAASPTGASQVVGWPPIRAYRMNSMANQAKSIATGEHCSEFDEKKQQDEIYGANAKGNTASKDRAPVRSSLFVKVNLDGAAIGRKVDLSAHPGYESLARILEEMFINKESEKSSSNELMLMPKVTRPSKLLGGSSEYKLTYEDKDGDWMLVGDVPWGMFISSVKRLRIMRTSEANGLAPRLEQRSAKQRNRPI